MIAVDPNIVRRIIGSVGLILEYGFSLRHIFKTNPGNKFIECGSITVLVFVVTMTAIRIRYFPAWGPESLALAFDTFPT